MASPGTVISAEASVDISVQHVDVTLRLQPSVDDATILVTSQTQEVSLPVYAPDANGVYQGFIVDGVLTDPRTTGEVDDGLTPLVPVDSLKEATIPTYYGDNQEFAIPVLPLYLPAFVFSVNTENLVYSSYNYVTYRAISYQGEDPEIIQRGDVLSTAFLGVAGDDAVALGYSVGDVIPRGPSVHSWKPTATPSDGTQVKKRDGTLAASPVATVISSANNQYTLPTISGGTYNFEVSWGDGTTSSIDSWDHADVVHTYPSPGVYDISITGTFEGIMFARHGDDTVGGTGNVDARKLLEVKNWGQGTYLDLNARVDPWHPLSTPSNPLTDTEGLTGTNDKYSGVFDGCVNWNDVSGEKPNFKHIPGIDHPNGTVSGNIIANGKFWGSSNNTRLFRGCNSMGFDMSVWGPADEPFIGGANYGQFNKRAPSYEPPGLKLNYHWTDANPNYGAYSRPQIYNADATGVHQNTVDTWDTTNWSVKTNNEGLRSYSLQASFGGLRGFDGDVSGLVKPGVENMYGCFSNNVSFTGKGIETWDTSTVTDFGTCFQNCNSLNKSFSHFTFSEEGANLNSMLYLCNIYNQSFSDWDVKNITRTSRLVKDVPAYNNGGQAWTNAHWKRNTSFAEMFRNTQFNQDVSKWILPSSADVPQNFNMSSTFLSTPFNRPVDTYEEDGVTYWDMSNCRGINSMFSGCDSFNQNLDNWDVRNVIDMGYAFDNADVFNGSVSNWQPDSCAKMAGTFRRTNFNQPVNTRTEGGKVYWGVSSVTDFSTMFLNTPFNQPLDAWDTSSATNMESMFQEADDFNQPINSWDVSNVENFDRVFHHADSFNQDLNNWNVSSGTKFTKIFDQTNMDGDCSTWTFREDVDIESSYMFGNCPALFEGSKDLSGWNTKKFTNLFAMFYQSSLKRRNYWGAVDPSKLTYNHNGVLYFPDWSPNIGGWDVGNVTIFSNMCYSAGTFNDDLSGWDVSSGTTFGRMLHNCFLFNRNLSSWNVSNATSMHEMFRGCNAFNNGGSDGIKDWDVSNVTDFGEMFYNNINFNQPLTNWDTSSATIMHRMFYNASSFNQSIAHFNTSNVISMARMLELSSVNEDLSSWNLSSMSTDAIVDGTQLPPIVDVFKSSAMSKANLDATIQGWCTTIPSGLDLGQIPLDGTGGNVLHADTITAMVGKSLTAQYTDGTEVTS